MTKLTISEAAKLKGVSTDTLRRWEEEGKLTPERTSGGHRRYELSELLGIKGESSYTIAYCRVSSPDQKEDMKRQRQVLELFCAQHGWQFEVIEDFGSGMNYSKRGLQRLIRMIASNQVERLVLTHKDRLLRFGSELIFSLCEHFGTEVVIINRTEDSSFEEDLANDVLEIITVFSARLYGSRSHKNKKIVEELRDAAQRI
ncbi:IS607 family transposase [Chroogloeocystis siderophila]|uniref:IS607 family transposase n=1 Tax=Chroogloeocystis siderophila 5.2 s.c.1 TaxID=247279 RepID=A0A1U7HQI5_9CHRO|nr:IS607 family transposase [Chroogloeocystis siderophila]OKH25808.1 IS607 family transposase [Chroogloeocystis siderophila 5.2 s.c.1]